MTQEHLKTYRCPRIKEESYENEEFSDNEDSEISYKGKRR